MSGEFLDSSASAARPTSRNGGLALVLALFALAFSAWTFVVARGSRTTHAAPSGTVEERLERIEASLAELQQSLGPADEAGRSASDRLLVAENKSLLLHDTLEQLVEHVRKLEQELQASSR